MIANICTLLLVVSSAMAFSGVSTRSRSMTMMAEKSKALPFLARPEKVINVITKSLQILHGDYSLLTVIFSMAFFL